MQGTEAVSVSQKHQTRVFETLKELTTAIQGCARCVLKCSVCVRFLTTALQPTFYRLLFLICSLIEARKPWKVLTLWIVFILNSIYYKPIKVLLVNDGCFLAISELSHLPWEGGLLCDVPLFFNCLSAHRKEAVQLLNRIWKDTKAGFYFHVYHLESGSAADENK